MNLQLDTKAWWSIVGLGCLWPCLQSSGFYPLSLISAITNVDPTQIARYHVLYSVALLALFILVAVFHRKLEAFIATNQACPLIAGVFGICGHGLLMSSSLDQPFAQPGIVAAIVLISVFVAFFVVVWGVRLSGANGKQLVAKIGLSFVLAQIIQLLWIATTLPYGLLMCVLSTVTALCALQSPVPFAELPANVPATKTSALKKLPLGMICISLLLIYFCVIYVRLQMPGFGGDSSMFMKLFASIVSFVIFAIIVLCLEKAKSVERGFVVGFAVLICGYFIGLCGILLFVGDGETMARRVLIADEHCVEAFLWMVVAFTASRQKLSGTLLFSLFGILVVTMPWLLSFDVRYLVPTVDAIAGSEWLSMTVTGAMLCTALASTAFLVHYALSVSREAVAQVGVSQQELAAKALANTGLTERELEVATYVFRGYSAKRIAEVLYLSEATVKSYTSKIYRKLNVRSKQEFIDYVDEHSVL